MNPKSELEQEQPEEEGKEKLKLLDPDAPIAARMT